MATTSRSIARIDGRDVSLTTPDSSDELEKALKVERGRLKHSFDELKATLREQADVRTHVREHPAIAAAAAFAVGATLGILSSRGSRRSHADEYEEDDDDGARLRLNRTSNAVGQFAAVVLDMAGRRIIEVAESSMRDAWARRKRAH